MSGRIDRPNAEDNIVLGERNSDISRIAGRDNAGPVGLAGVAVNNLEGRAGREAKRFLPAKCGAGVVGWIEDRNVARLAGCERESSQSRGVEAGNVGDIVEVDKFE